MLWWWRWRLRSPDRATRINAVRKLGESGKPDAVQPLVDAMLGRGGRPPLAEAAEALGKLGHPAVLGRLISALGAKPNQVQLAARDALKAIDPNWATSAAARAAVPELLAFLERPGDGEVWLVALAAETLGRLRDRRGLAPLLTLLSGYTGKASSDSKADAAAAALAELGDPAAVPHLIKALQAGLVLAAPALGKLADRRGIPALVAAYADAPGVASQHEVAAAALQQIDPNWLRSAEAGQAVPLLIDKLAHQIARGYADEHIDAVLSVLGQVDPGWRAGHAAFAVPKLIGCLTNPSYHGGDVRNNVWAARLLGEIDPRWPDSAAANAAVPQLLTVLRETVSGDSANAEIDRKRAAHGLGCIGTTAAVPALLESITDPHVAGEVVEALSSVLVRNGTSIPRQDLEAIAALPESVSKLVYEGTFDGQGIPKLVSENCRRIKAMASQELGLARRQKGPS